MWRRGWPRDKNEAVGKVGRLHSQRRRVLVFGGIPVCCGRGKSSWRGEAGGEGRRGRVGEDDCENDRPAFEECASIEERQL